MPNLYLDDITKTFGATRAVDELTVEVQEGESVVLLGPSGCGKTTLLKLIAGFLKPDNGRVLVGDQVLSNQFEIMPPDKRKMSMVFQSYAIWPHKTVFQNVAYGLQVRKMNKPVITRITHDFFILSPPDICFKHENIFLHPSVRYMKI